ncbi:uncharacterized protein LOC129981284 [Argiope bruennichi]|uniref:uncharacterized protein LOC129981284 n=1 Tax=Argiope bruennichi TaxID=94029 RepID=UPI002494F928|nr:uncharacterized protein LOC129981284 [Argiope bruennichi]
MEDNQAPSETSDKPKYEKKCEREFRKLLESGNHKNNGKTYCQKKFVFSGNAKKKLKYGEQSTCKDPEFPIHMSDCENSSHKINSVSAKCTSNKDLDSLFEILTHEHKPETRCQSVINLAILCSENLSSVQLSTILNALHHLSNSHESEVLAISYSVLLFTLSKNTLNLDQIIYLEETILKLAESVLLNTNELGNESIVSKLSSLRGEEYLSAIKLCQELFSRKNIDFDAVDVLTLCCSSLRNLSCNKIGEKYKYKPSTLNFILGMTGKATQEIVSENLVADEEGDTSAVVSAPSHMVNQCLQILEHMLTVDPDLPCRTLDHEDFSLLHCLTRLFGWCMSFLFQKNPLDENHLRKVEKSLSSFHLATLLSILKILSILSFNPDQYDTFTNIKGLMEKVMICILKAYYQSEEKHFDILVLALELMINFFMKNKKTFVLLCLKKFQINGCENVHSIEALLKILTNSLDKINEIKARSLTRDANGEENGGNGNPDDADMKSVLEAADEDMELSTIVSFISILLAFFMDTKMSFVEFIRERLSSEKANEAVTVSKKVLQFASITGGMPATGILLLRHAIRKLGRLYLPT